MSLPDFELGPLEMEEVHEDEPRVDPASARVKVGEDWFLLRECSNELVTILFCRLDAPNSPILKSYYWPAEHSLHSYYKKLEEILQDWSWSRNVDFSRVSTDLELRISTKSATWRRRMSDERVEWVLPHEESIQWLIKKSDEEIYNYIAPLIEEVHGSCFFALEWMSLDEVERFELATRLYNGSWFQFEEVLRWLAWDRMNLDGEEKIWRIWADCPNNASDEDWINTHLESYYCFDSKNGAEVDIPDDVQKILRIIHCYFRPSYDHTLYQYLAVEKFIGENYLQHNFSVPVPSQHERLEASLRLREWLSDKVAPEEIPALLGEA